MNKKPKSKAALLIVICISLAIVLTSCLNSKQQSLILATTTSLNDTGLLSYLIPEFEGKTGIEVKTIAVGSGEALKMAEMGNADIVLAHSPGKEKQLLKKGVAVKRISFMYNYFVIVGPKNDPADISTAASAQEAFKRIKLKNQKFISRGDESGTNKKEIEIWRKVGSLPLKLNYIKTGQGMLETLQVANEKQAYTLSDKATYIANKNNLQKLAILLTNKETLKNVYSVIELNPKKLKFNVKGAHKFKRWLLSKSVLNKISSFGVNKYKQPLFYLY